MLAPTYTAGPKQLIAHRGASAYAPEHTLEAYRLAIDQGADYVEQDLALTRDGVLVCIHDLTLERTTNVEEVFPDRFTTDTSKGSAERRWLVNDFTLAELRQLDAGSWFAPKFAGARIPTFQEAIDLVKGKAGLYPELKDPAFYRSRGASPEQAFADALERNGLPSAATPVVVQTFDAPTVKTLASRWPAVQRVFLVDRQDGGLLATPEALREIRAWATGIGPHKEILEQNPAVVKWAQDAGLTVAPWTFGAASKADYDRLRSEMRRHLYEFGVDALFTDNPDQFPRR